MTLWFVMRCDWCGDFCKPGPDATDAEENGVPAGWEPYKRQDFCPDCKEDARGDRADTRKRNRSIRKQDGAT